MQSATHSPSSITVTPKDDSPAQTLGTLHPGGATTEVSSSQIQLPSNTLTVQEISLPTVDALMPVSQPSEPQEGTAAFLRGGLQHSIEDAESDQVKFHSAAPQLDSKHAQPPTLQVEDPCASGSLPPPREVMTGGELRRVYSLRFGDGSAECQQCAECCAGCGVGFLALSVGVWACHCSHAVPFAITGGSLVGATYVHAMAKEWGCIPEIHSSLVFKPAERS